MIKRKSLKQLPQLNDVKSFVQSVYQRSNNSKLTEKSLEHLGKQFNEKQIGNIQTQRD